MFVGLFAASSSSFPHLCHAVAVSPGLCVGVGILGQLAREAEVGDPQLAVSGQ